jgi:hypothetical protein
MVEALWTAVGALMCVGVSVAARYLGWGRLMLIVLALAASYETVAHI